MAYLGGTADGGNYYNVNFAVGLNAANRRDDVLLVQWMLHRVYTDSFLPPPDDKGITIDGWIGKQTILWITAFQRDMRRLSNSCNVDGRVDSARKTTAFVTKTIYTILWLNGVIQQTNPTVYFDPASDPDCPKELLVALANNTSTPGPYVAEIPVPATGGA